jgi:hypothetical protein
VSIRARGVRIGTSTKFSGGAKSSKFLESLFNKGVAVSPELLERGKGALDQLVTFNKLSALRAELNLPQVDARDVTILAQAMAEIRTILTKKGAPKRGA